MRKITRFLSVLLTICLITELIPGAVVAAGDGMPFKDVRETDWFYEAVQYVYEKGMMRGTGDTTFSPESTTTRAMIVTILHRLEGLPAAAGEQYADVPSGQYYTDAVAWASENGIVNGYGNGKFGPNDAITREQMATILYRFAQFKAYDVSNANDLSSFSDGSNVHDWARAAMSWANAVGLIMGVGNNRLNPTGNALRSQAAAILMRFDNSFAPNIPTPPEMESYTIRFETNGGSNILDQTVKEGNYATKPDDPTKKGASFAGWYADFSLQAEYAFNTPVYSDTVLYAKWRENNAEGQSFLDEPDPDIEIYSFDIDMRSIPVGQRETVTFTSEIFSNIKINIGDVCIVSDHMEKIGIMHDDGLDGDSIANDGVYTLQKDMISPIEDEIEYHVAVKDVVSNGLGIGYYEPLTNEELEQINQVDSGIISIQTSAEFVEASDDEKIRLLINKLEDYVLQGLITKESVFYDKTTKMIEFQYQSGVFGGVYLTELHKHLDDSSAFSSLETNALLLGEVEERKVIVYNGFEDEPKRREYYEQLKIEWDSLGLKTKVDTDVTVKDMKKLSDDDYDVIVFAMHGDHYKGIPILCLNESVTSSTDSKYSYELKTKKSVVRLVDIYGVPFYNVLPSFFGDNYDSNALDGKLIYSESCCFYGCDCISTAPDYSMADAFTALSAEAVVGYHNSVEMFYSRDVMRLTIENTFNLQTIVNSLDAAKEVYGNNDGIEDIPFDKYIAYPIISGNSLFILRGAGTLAGSVKDTATGIGIENALVRIYDKNGREMTSVRTDSSGYYNAYLYSGDYVIKVTAGKYLSEKTIITVTDNSTTNSEILLRSSIVVIRFHGNGADTNAGTPMPNQEEEIYSLVVLNVNSFHRNGYHFIGWKDGRGHFYEDGQPDVYLPEDLDLYAQWEPNEVTITFHPNGGSPNQSFERTYAYGADVELEALYKNGDYALAGWCENADGSGDIIKVKTIKAYKNRDLYAIWSKPATIQFIGNEGMTDSGSTMYTQSIDTFIDVKLEENRFHNPGYRFDGWTTNPNGPGETYENLENVNLKGNLTLYAKWAFVGYRTIHFAGNGYQNLTGSMDDMTVLYDDLVTLPENKFAYLGYKFVCWSTTYSTFDGKDVNDQGSFRPTENVTLYAQWNYVGISTIHFVGSIYLDEDVSGSMSELNVTTGDTITLPKNEFTRPGYIFRCWNTSYNGMGEDIKDQASYTAKEDITLYAQWTEHNEDNSCGDNLTWSFDESTGVLTITGSGEMYDWNYSSKDVPWNGYCDSIIEVTFPQNLTSIGSSAFNNCVGLTEINIPSGVTSIGGSAFYNCVGLTEINIPSSVTSIGGSAFYNCVGLTEIKLPEGLTDIGFYAFYGTSITSIIIPKMVTKLGIGDGINVFSGAKLLEKVEFAEGTTVIPGAALSWNDYYSDDWCNVKQVILPESVRIIRYYAFNGCFLLTQIDLPKNIEMIDDYAFMNCGLEEIILPENLTYIGVQAFSDCFRLTEVTIPESVTTVDLYAFAGCDQLKNITISNPQCSIGESELTLGDPKITTIYGYPGSTAEKYANSYGYTFESILGKD